MYPVALFLHSWLRWVVLAFAVWAVVRALVGIGTRRAWAPADETASRWFTISLDVQFLLGLLLYGLLSPITTQAFSDMGGTMRDPILRFWALEHVIMMLIGLAFAHIGRSRVRRAATDFARHRTSAIFYTLALLVTLAAIPWPFMAAGRPLLRF